MASLPELFLRIGPSEHPTRLLSFIKVRSRLSLRGQGPEGLDC